MLTFVILGGPVVVSYFVGLIFWRTRFSMYNVCQALMLTPAKLAKTWPISADVSVHIIDYFVPLELTELLWVMPWLLIVHPESEVYWRVKDERFSLSAVWYNVHLAQLRITAAILSNSGARYSLYWALRSILEGRCCLYYVLRSIF